MTDQIPLVDYLVLDDGEPHLVANDADLAAPLLRPPQRLRLVLRIRVSSVPVATDGEVRAFTIVTFAAPAFPCRSWRR